MINITFYTVIKLHNNCRADFETNNTFKLLRRNNFMKTIKFLNETGNYLLKVTGIRLKR
jgi:hypothetical protein